MHHVQVQFSHFRKPQREAESCYQLGLYIVTSVIVMFVTVISGGIYFSRTGNPSARGSRAGLTWIRTVRLTGAAGNRSSLCPKRKPGLHADHDKKPDIFLFFCVTLPRFQKLAINSNFKKKELCMGQTKDICELESACEVLPGPTCHPWRQCLLTGTASRLPHHPASDFPSSESPKTNHVTSWIWSCHGDFVKPLSCFVAIHRFLIPLPENTRASPGSGQENPKHQAKTNLQCKEI